MTKQKTNAKPPRSPLADGLNLRSSKDRATLKAREAQAELNALLDKYLKGRGATYDACNLGEYTLSTPLGELRVTPAPAHMVRSPGLTIFTRFAVDAIKCAVAAKVISSLHSGKHNFHFSDRTTILRAYELFCAWLASFAPVEQVEDDIPPCVASMGCLCAGHARGNPADTPCDTSEEAPTVNLCVELTLTSEEREGIEQRVSDLLSNAGFSVERVAVNDSEEE